MLWIIQQFLSFLFFLPHFRTSLGSTLTNMRVLLPPYVRTLIHWMNPRQGGYGLLQVQILIGKKLYMYDKDENYVYFLYLNMFPSYFSCMTYILHDLLFRSWQGVLDTTLCDIVCQWLAPCLWFSTGTLVSSTNKTDRHDMTEILLKVEFNTINLNLHDLHFVNLCKLMSCL